jgi:hypothetical protein
MNINIKSAPALKILQTSENQNTKNLRRKCKYGESKLAKNTNIQ